MDVLNRVLARQCIICVTVLLTSVPCLAGVSWNHSQPDSASVASLFISSLQTSSFTQNAKQLLSQKPPTSVLQTTIGTLLHSHRKSTQSAESVKSRYSSKPVFSNRTFPSSFATSEFLSDFENSTELYLESNRTRPQSQEVYQVSLSQSNSTLSDELRWPHKVRMDIASSENESSRDTLKSEISMKAGNQSSVLNGTQSNKEPVLVNSSQSLYKVIEKKVDGQFAFKSYSEVEGNGDSNYYDDDQGYPEQGFGSDDYGTFGDGVGKRRYGQRQELFRDYEDLQDEPSLTYNYTNPSMTKRKDVWSRDRRIDYDGLYDLHLMQELPENSNALRRTVSLNGKLSSERIDVSLVVIYGWLGLVILMIVTSLVVLKYKQKLSVVCWRASNACQLSSSCQRVRGFDEGNNLLAHPLV